MTDFRYLYMKIHNTNYNDIARVAASLTLFDYLIVSQKMIYKGETSLFFAISTHACLTVNKRDARERKSALLPLFAARISGKNYESASH